MNTMKNHLLTLCLIIQVSCLNSQFVSIGPTGSSTYNANNSHANGTGQIHCIAFHPNFPTTNFILAGSPFGGLWKSTDGGSTWSVVDAVQHLETNSVNEITISYIGTTTTIYIATGSSNTHSPYIPSCGLYKSTDLGNTFTPVPNFNTLGTGFTFHKRKLVTKVAVHPTNPDIVFVATSDGLYKSTNATSASASWQLVLTENEPPANWSSNWLDPEVPGIWAVQFSPNDPNTVYASGQNVYRSTSSGNSGTFSILTNTAFDNFFPTSAFTVQQRNMNFKVVNNSSVDNIYCTAFAIYKEAYTYTASGVLGQNTITTTTAPNGVVSGMNVSGTGIGDNAVVSSVLGNVITLSKVNSGTVSGTITFSRNVSHFGMYLHNNTAWSTIATDNNQWSETWHIPTVDRLKLDVRPANVSTVVAGSTQVLRSTNSGSTWNALTQYYSSGHPDIHELKYEPNGTFLLIGNDGGIYKYTEASGLLEEVNIGLSVSTITDMSVSPSKKNFLAIGKQDTNYDWFNGNSWTQDGEYCDGYAPAWWDLTQDSKFYGSYNGNLKVRDVVANTKSTVNSSIDCGYPIGQLYQHPLPQFGDRFFALQGANQKLYFTNSANHSTGYDLLENTNFPGVHSIKNFNIPKSDPNVMYTTTNAFGFWNDAKLLKFRLNEFTLSPDANCATEMTCNNPNGCFTELKYLDDACRNFFPATAVAVSSSNKDKIWVAIDWQLRYLTASQYPVSCGSTHYKIRKTVNGGVNPSDWVADDAGLPDYGITSLVYVDGSNDAMFCATANGRIFYKNAGLSSWQEVDVNLPHTAISKLEINYCTKRLYVATFGRGVYYLDLNTYIPHTAQSLDINSNTTWSSGYYDIGSNVVVKSGNTLTINGTTNGTIVNMCKNCKIVVEKNARLLVTNAKITNSCGELWAGIEVLGDNTQAQIAIDLLESSPYTNIQGACVVRTSTFEFMDYGLKLGKHVWPGNYNDAGGQLISDGCLFKNNVRSISTTAYTPPSDPANPLGAYKSKIKDTDFDNTTVNLFKHVILSGVRGFSIEGCIFDNHVPVATQPYSNRGYGIHALQGEFIALTNAQSLRKNNFNNLTYGIRIDVGGLSFPPGNTIGTKINDAVFTNNKYGIYMASGTYARITNNTFTVPGLDDCLNGVGGGDCKSYGLYLAASTAYKVQENIFNISGYTMSFAKTYGVLVNNAAANDEKIRSNTLTGLRYGLVAVGVNSNQPSLNGLEFRCNTLNQSKAYDTWVTEDGTTQGSMKLNQGSCANAQSPANNLFYQQSATVPTFQLARNANTLSYTYYSLTNSSNNTFYPARTQTTNTIAVTACGFNYSNFPAICPDESDGGDYSPLLINQWNGQMIAMKSNIDGGNTAELKDMLNTATAYNIEDVYQTLKEKEAISDEVMEKAIESPVAEYGLEELKELIIKNSGLEEKQIDDLVEAQLPFSASEIAEMEAAQNQISPEDEIKQAIAVQEEAMSEKMLEWSHQYLEKGDADSALLMLKIFENQSTLNHLAAISLRSGKTTEAKTALQKLGDANMVDFVTIVEEMKAQGKDWKQTDETVKNALWGIYAKGGRAAIYASSVLAEVADTALLPYIPDEEIISAKTEEVPVNKWKLMKTVNNTAFSVSPNPVSRNLNVSFESKDATSVNVTISDISGAVVYTAIILATKSEIDVSAWQSGVYIIRGTDDIGQKYFRKFNVMH